MSQTLPSLSAAASPLNTASLILIDDANEANPLLTSKKATLAQVITATTAAITAAGINSTAIGATTPSTVSATTLTLSPFTLTAASGTVLRITGTGATNTLQLYDGTNAYGLALYEGVNPRTSILSTGASSFFYGINGTPIGTGSPSTGAFTSLTTTLGVTATGAISASNFSGTSSGTNTGDQTTISGNAATATALQNTRTIGGSSFNGTANVTSFPSPGAIGGTTPATGAFTTLSAGGAITASGGVLFSGGGGISGALGTVTLTASGTNKPVVLNSSGTGDIETNASIVVYVPVGGEPSLKLWTGASERATLGWSSVGSYFFLYSQAQSGDILRAYNNYTVLSPVSQRTVIGTNTDDGSTKLQVRGGISKFFDTTESNSVGTGALQNLGGFSNTKNLYNGGNIVSAGTVTGSNLSGTNTGDQTNISGNAATATALQTARTINGVSFNGTANITLPASVPVGVLNRSALRAYTGMVNGQFITEQGYDNNGDGGGGVWTFLSSDNYSVDNDGTLVVPGGTLGSTATAGCWHRVGVGTSGLNKATKLDIRWFGALPNKSTDCSVPITNAFNALKNLSLPGSVYAPAGWYVFRSNVTIDVTGLDLNYSFIGDGAGATNFKVSLQSSGLPHVIKFIGCNSLKLSDFMMQRENVSPAPYYSPSGPYIVLDDITNAHVSRVDGRDIGSFIQVSAVDWLEMAGCSSYGTNSGTQLSFDGGGGTVTGCSFKTVPNSAPCLWVKASNSLQIADSFFEGGGPYKTFGATITSTSSNFTVTATAHGFNAGDYVLLTGASIAGYNGLWKVSASAANYVIITSTINLGVASATLSTIHSSGLFGGKYGVTVTESTIDQCLFNTGGAGVPLDGSAGIWLEGRGGANVAGLKITGCTLDFGSTAVFAHGVTYQATNVLGGNVWGSNVKDIEIENTRPNGGPRNAFGAFRFEGVSAITLGDGFCASGDNNPPGTGKTFNSVVISDGGQSYYTQDIVITGGIYTSAERAELFPSASLYAFVFDGPNVRRVSVSGVGVDTTSSNAYVTRFINGASAGNGISVTYSDAGGASRFDNIDVRGGNAVLGILQTTQVKLVPETGYPSGGAVPISFGGNTSIYIPLTIDATFSTTDLASGNYIFLALKNTTGGTLTLSWPAGWTWAGVSAPASLASGSALLIRAFAYGTSNSDVIATY